MPPLLVVIGYYVQMADGDMTSAAVGVSVSGAPLLKYQLRYLVPAKIQLL